MSVARAPGPPTRTLIPSVPRAASRTSFTNASRFFSSVPGALLETAYIRVLPSGDGTASGVPVSGFARVIAATWRDAVARSAERRPPSRW